MEDYVIIDCSKNLTKTKINQFYKYSKEHNIVDFVCLTTGKLFTNADELFRHVKTTNFTDEMLSTTDNKISIAAVSNDYTINMLIGKDTLHWGSLKDDRWNTLFSIDNNLQIKTENVLQNKTSKQSNVFCFAICNYEDDNFINIKYCIENNKKLAIEFLNNEIKERVLTSFMKTVVKINLHFDSDEYEKTKTVKNDDMWFTVKELAEMGVVKLA